MQKIGPCLWFDGRAQEAAEFYVSVFPNSQVVDDARYPEGPRGEAGTVMTVRFVLDGEEFMGLNGGPLYSFTPAVSFVVMCDSQTEIDDYWAKLTDGGVEVQCGWLTDRFGLSWQIVPEVLAGMLNSPDKAAAKRANAAMLAMIKLDIAKLQAAYDGIEPTS